DVARIQELKSMPRTGKSDLDLLGFHTLHVQIARRLRVLDGNGETLVDDARLVDDDVPEDKTQENSGAFFPVIGEQQMRQKVLPFSWRDVAAKFLQDVAQLSGLARAAQFP